MNPPTQQQHAIIQAVAAADGNWAVNALAGTGKTTTIMASIQAYALANPSHKILGTAFNKRIAEALVDKASALGIAGADFWTFNSLGYRDWIAFCPNKVKLDTSGRRLNNILRNCGWEWDQGEDLPRLYSLLCSNGWVCAEAQHKFQIKALTDLGEEGAVDLIEDHDLSVQPDWWDICQRANVLDIEQGMEGQVDFRCQVYLPAIFRTARQRYHLVMVDEAQDLDRCQMQLIANHILQPRGRIIVVGDRHQAIYGFRGADYGSMDSAIERWRCQELPLTRSFRCPQAVVREAQRYVEQIEAVEGAPEGKVEHHTHIALGAFGQADVILCRNTKPLVSLVFRFYKAGIPAKVLGRDIGEGLVKMVKKIATAGDTLQSFCARLEAWGLATTREAEAKGKTSKAALLQDRVDTILIIANAMPPGTTMQSFYQRIESLFTDDRERLTLSTIHKAKGLEWGKVWFLDPGLIPSRFAKSESQLQQERNIAYVGTTRAMRELHYITTEGIIE